MKIALENEDLGTINGNFIKHYPKGSDVQLLLQPEDLEHDDKSNLKLEVVDRKFRGTNFIYTLKTLSSDCLYQFLFTLITFISMKLMKNLVLKDQLILII